MKKLLWSLLLLATTATADPGFSPWYWSGTVAKTLPGITSIEVNGSPVGGISLGAFGSTPAAQGASVSGSTLTMQPFDLTHPGSTSVGAQTMAGPKTIAGSTVAMSTNIAGMSYGYTDINSRTDLWLNGTSPAVYIGSWKLDTYNGASNNLGKGIITIGNSLVGGTLSDTEGGYGRYESDHAYFYSIDPAALGFTGGGSKFWSVDKTEQYYKNNAGVKTFNVDRATGNTDVGGNLTISGVEAFGAGDISRSLVIYDDFVGGFYASGLCGSQVTWNCAGGVTGTYMDGSSHGGYQNPGILELTTGASPAGLGFLSSAGGGVKSFYLGGGATYFEIIVKLDTLSDVTDSYLVNAGISTGDTVETVANGIYFSYSDLTNSGNWTGRVSASGSTTSRDTGVAASTSSYQSLGWTLNAAGDSVQFYVNHIAVGSPVTTNIPANTTPLRPSWTIVKTGGTNSRSLYTDAVKIVVKFNTPR